MSKLSNGGIRELKLVAKHHYMPSVLPDCIAHFKLRSLHFEHKREVFPTRDQVRGVLKNLQPGLKQLHLDFLGSLELFLNEHESLPSSPVKRPAVGSHSFPTYDLMDRWHVGSLFQELTSLDIHDRLYNSSGLQNEHLAALPRSLVHFGIQSLAYKGNLLDLSLLPEKLTFLSLPSLSVNQYNIHQLPSTLTKLQGNCMTVEALQMLVKDDAEGLLLPHLIEFPWDCTTANTEQNNSTMSVLYDDLGKLPSKMRDISLRTLNMIEALPSSLTSLTLYNSIDMKLFSHLPPMLVGLAVESLPWSEIQASSWPPKLQCLSVTRDTDMGVHLFHRLPRSLLRFKQRLSNQQPYTPWTSDSSPFLVEGRTFIEGIEKETWLKQRQELIEHGKRNEGREAKRMELYISEVEQGSLLGLPLTLVELKLHYMIVEGKKPLTKFLYPPHLTSAELEFNFDLKAYHHLLPPFLTHLGTNPPPGTSHNALANAEYGKFSSIQSMKIFSCSTQMGSSIILNFFPMSLRKLELVSIGKASDGKWLECLPSNLEHLTLYASMQSNSFWPKYLPKNLLYLKTGSLCKLSGPQLEHLPPKLTALTTCLSEVSLPQLLSLPRTLLDLHFDLALKGGSQNQLDLRRLLRTVLPFWRIWHIPIQQLRLILAGQAPTPPHPSQSIDPEALPQATRRSKRSRS